MFHKSSDMDKVHLKTNSDDALDLKALLQQTHNEALEQNEKATQHWIKLRDEHMTLYSHLGTLPDRLSHDVMVPIGSKALMRGKMVHTNEILVCLGDGWFVKQSAKEATEICNRRIKVCEGMLKDLERERDLLISRKELPLQQDAFGGESGKEIMEPYNEEEETNWRAEHRQKEKEYRQRLAELQKNETTPIKNEESLWRRLDELELQEELEEELDRLHAEMEERGYGDGDEEEEDEDDDDNDDDEEEENETDEEYIISDHELVDSENSQGHRIKNKIEVANNDQYVQPNKRPQSPSYRKRSPTAGETNSEPQRNESRRVSFADEKPPSINNDDSDSGDEPLRIEFHHTPVELNPQLVKADNIQPIQSPADIYEFIREQVPHESMPKSILKRRSGDLGTVQSNDSCDPLLNSYKEESASAAIQQAEVEEHPVVVGDVVEHSSEEVSVSPGEPLKGRPVSKFRASRKAKKR